MLKFIDGYVWDLYPIAFNTTHRYQFITREKEVVSYDQAEYLDLTNLADGKHFNSLPCKGEKDKITLYPGDDFEAVFDRVTD